MNPKEIYFAGGGTGGHIYPAIAVAEKIMSLCPEVKLHFFISDKANDLHIIKKTGFEYTALPAKGFSGEPKRFLEFLKSFLKSAGIAAKKISQSKEPVVVGCGGFVAGAVCLAAWRLKTGFKLINVDIVPGRANKLFARFADRIFVSFGQTAECFKRFKDKVIVTGCPLREGFGRKYADRAKDELGLSGEKKILLITGASSGSVSVNNAVCSLLGKLEEFGDTWQIVHLTGRNNFKQTEDRYRDVKISHRVLDYYDNLPGLLSCADLVIGRSGAVSVAEIARAGVASILMPYPHHRDMHQYLNASVLVQAGAAVIVDDVADLADRADWLWEELFELIKDDDKRRQMACACSLAAKTDAAEQIAKNIIGFGVS